MLIVQLLLCFIGVLIKSLRIISILILLWIVINSSGWYFHKRSFPKTCQQHTDSVSGILKSKPEASQSTAGLIKVRVWCKTEYAILPDARIKLTEALQSKLKWFKIGDEVEIRGEFKFDPSNASEIVIIDNPTNRVYNVSNQEKALSRSSFLLYIQSKARYYLTGFPLGVYKALTTADRSSIPKHWYKTMKDLGIVHIFAISGMHIGILYFWIAFALRTILTFPGPFSEKGRLLVFVDLVTLIGIVIFLNIIGMPISAKRAVIMLFWWLLIRHLFYWQPLWFVLLGTALTVLIQDPVAVGQLSFQLSFISVAGILVILPMLPRVDSRDSMEKRLAKPLLSIFLVSLWLMLLTFPVIQQITQSHSLLSPINNVINISFVSFIYLPLLMITFGIIAFGYPFYGFPGEFYIYSLIHFFSKVWEKVLVFNRWLNQFGLIHLEIDWTHQLLVGYWILLLVLINIARFYWTKKTGS